MSYGRGHAKTNRKVRPQTVRTKDADAKLAAAVWAEIARRQAHQPTQAA